MWNIPRTGSGSRGPPYITTMVKSLTAILIAAALLAGLGVWEWALVQREFRDFGEELHTLYVKAENETANGEDAKAVQTSWESRKEKLHVWIPHSDITRIDDYMSETVRLVSERNYAFALPKLEILIHLSECLPATYSPALENIF